MVNYVDIFCYENNNNEECLFFLQWMEGFYGLGNSCQVNWVCSSFIIGNMEVWGGVKLVIFDFM